MPASENRWRRALGGREQRRARAGREEEKKESCELGGRTPELGRGTRLRVRSFHGSHAVRGYCHRAQRTGDCVCPPISSSDARVATPVATADFHDVQVYDYPPPPLRSSLVRTRPARRWTRICECFRQARKGLLPWEAQDERVSVCEDHR